MLMRSAIVVQLLAVFVASFIAVVIGVLAIAIQSVRLSQCAFVHAPLSRVFLCVSRAFLLQTLCMTCDFAVRIILPSLFTYNTLHNYNPGQSEVVQFVLKRTRIKRKRNQTRHNIMHTISQW